MQNWHVCFAFLLISSTYFISHFLRTKNQKIHGYNMFRRTCVYLFSDLEEANALSLECTSDIRVTSKPLYTFEKMFPSPKYRPPPENQTNVVYQIGCSDCPWNYIGETGRAFNTRKKEHIRNFKQFKGGSNIAKICLDI